MAGRTGAIALACLLITTCGDDDDPGGNGAGVSDPTDAPGDRVMVGDGIVVIDLESSAPNYTDQLRLDVTESGDEVNESSVFAECTGLTGGEGRFRVGVTDLRRLEDDHPVLSVELVTARRVKRPGEYPVEALLIDQRQRQQELTGELTIDDDTLRRGSFAITDRRNVQVRGSFRCGDDPAEVATTTPAPPTNPPRRSDRPERRGDRRDRGDDQTDSQEGLMAS